MTLILLNNYNYGIINVRVDIKDEILLIKHTDCKNINKNESKPNFK